MSHYVQLDPVFRVHDWDATRPLLSEAMDKVKKGEDASRTHSYLFAQDDAAASSSGTTPTFLTLNEVYKDGNSLTQHLQNVGDILSKAIDGPCGVDKIYASGPAPELDMVRPHLDPLGSVTYFETLEDDPGVSHVTGTTTTQEAENVVDDELPSAFVILPIFKVHDWDKVRTNFIDPLYDVASKEAGCVYYSFAKNVDDNLLLVRERYVTVEAALQHLEWATPILASCLSDGILELQEASVYGTPGAIAASKSALDPFGTQYRSILHALDRFQVSSSSSSSSSSP